MKVSKSPVVINGIFLALTIALYFVGAWLIFRLSSATPLMLCVGFAAILTCLITRTNLRGLDWHWGSWKFHGLSYFLPLGYAAVAYGLIWVSGVGAWYGTTFVLEQKESYNLGTWSDTAVIFHMSHNVFLQKFFGPMTSEKADSAWFLDEFGAVVPAVIVVLAVFCWRKGNSEFQPESTGLITKH